MTVLGELNAMAAKLVEVDFPPQVMAETINRCNLQCIMCPSASITRSRGVMKMDLFRKIVDEIKMESPSTKLWPAVMGEPLLTGGRLFEMLAYAQQNAIAVHINTNATLLDKASIAQLKALGVREVIVGVDAFRPETYAKIRVGGNLTRVATNIETMISVFGSAGPRLILQFIVMPANANEAEPFRKHWTAKGAVVKIRRQQGWGELVAAEGLDIGQNERFMPCPWLFRNCLVLWDGEVCQCDGDVDNKHSCGNVTLQSIKEIWQGKMREIRNKQSAGNFDYPPCNHCRDWQVGLSKFYYPDNPDRPFRIGERD